MDKFDVILIERQSSLTKQDVTDILSVLTDGETFIPLEIEGDASSAMGFITYHAADRINFLTDKDHFLYQSIREILDDVEKENMLCVYDFEEVSDYGEPLKILLTRDLPSTIERLNRKPVGSYCLSNTASVLVHEIDPWGEWLIASLNGDDMQVCEITQAEKDDSTSEDNVETGFYYGNTWIPMNQVMRL